MNSEHLDAAIAEFLQAEAAGQHPQPQAWLERYPELHESLAAFFADRAKLERLVAQVGQASAEEDTLPATGQWQPPAEPPTLALDTAAAPEPPKVRYFGDYELLEEIARGGMGVVFKARQVSLNRVVALKMILAGKLAGAEEVKRFRTEAEAAANLDHPHIVPIYEVGEHQGQQYFSMKYIEGGSLAAQFSLAPQARRGVHDLVALLLTVTQAVHHAHQRGILHRDLKPANILLDKEGQPHVTDFGLAKKVTNESTMTRTGAIMGTPSYMAPEQAAAKKQLTTAVDVYALGAILYEILTGRPPFKAESPLDTLFQVMEKEPTPPRTHAPTVDRDLETICLKCLEKEPEKRYGSAQAFAEELERWQHGEPIHARPATRRERLIKWAKRKPAAAALIGISLLAVILVVTVLGVFNGLLADALADRTRALDERTATLKDLSKEQAATKAFLEREQFAGYVQRVNAAWMAWNANDVPRARQLLAECPPELRGWEWHYVHRLCNLPVRRFPCSTVRGRAGFALSKDGKRLATERQEHITVWNVADGGQIARFPQEFVNGVAFNADGTQLYASLSNTIYMGGGAVSGTFSKVGSVPDPNPPPPRPCVRVWSLPEGREIGSWRKGPENSLAMATSPDGTWVAAIRPSEGGRRSLDLWNLARKDETVTLAAYMASEEPALIGFSADGRLLAVSARGGDLTIWDAVSHKQLWSYPPPGFETVNTKSRRWVQAFAFDPESQQLALATAPVLGMSIGLTPVFGAARITLLDARTGKNLGELPAGGLSVTAIDYQPGGRWLALGGKDGSVRILDRKEETIVGVLHGHSEAVVQVAFTPDGQQLLSCGLDGEICLWDMRLPRQDLHRVEGIFAFMCLMRDHSLVTMQARGTRTAKVEPVALDLEDGGLKHTLGCRYFLPCGWAISPNGQVLALASCNMTMAGGTSGKERRCALELFRLDTGKQLQLLTDDDQQIVSLAFARDGQHLLAVDLGNTLRRWDMPTGQLLETKKLPGSAAMLCPGGEKALIAAKEGAQFRLTVHDIAENRERHRLPFLFSSLEQISFTADGRLLAFQLTEEPLGFSGAKDRFPWSQTPSGLTTTKIPNPARMFKHQEPMVSEVLLVDLETGNVTHRKKMSDVYTVALSPDGTQVVLGRSRQTELWDVARWTPVFTLRGMEATGLFSVGFSPDGRYLVSFGLGLSPSEFGLFFWDSGRRDGK